MKIILATSNKGKVREIKDMMNDFDVMAYSDLIEPFDIIEDGSTFQANALIKAQAVFDKLSNNDNYIVMSDDSGISVPELGGEPGIYSARYAGVGASDEQNLQALIAKLKSANIQRTSAFYTACIAITSKLGTMTTHGWMHGEVIDEAIGDKGFGYDPMFIPYGYELTLGEIDESIKNSFSHRSKALELARILIKANFSNTNS